MKNRVMTFDEIFRAIAGGDMRVLAGFTIECLIMLSPLIVIAGAVWSTSQ